MVKLTTRLINETNKPLVLCEEASNGSQTRIKVLDPRVDNQQTPEGELLVTNPNTRKTELAGHSPSLYVHSVDPNDSYSTLRLWSDNEAVLCVSTDEMLHNKSITIKYENGVFAKVFEPRTSNNSTVGNFFKIHSRQ